MLRSNRATRRQPLDRLSAEDVAILRCEKGNVRGHTCKVLVLAAVGDGNLPTVDQLRVNIEARLDAAPRLRRRLVRTPLGMARPAWLDDPEFDITRHVAVIPTGGPVGPEELERIVSRLMGEQLDREHPLWQLNVVERLDDGSMALIWRLHHCLADGATCVRLGSAVLWSEQPSPLPPPPSGWTPRPAPGSLELLALGLAEHHVRSRGALHSRRVRRPGFRAAAAALNRELRPTAAVTPLARRAGTGRTVAFASAPLRECRQAGKRIDAAVTLNDVVLALVAGGVREWLAQGHGPTAGIRVKVPVSLHPAGEDDAAANRDSYFFVDLPVDEPDPIKRVLAINRESAERKLDHDAETLYRLGSHPAIAHWAMSPRVFTFNVSNVRGPASPIYVMGAPVRQMYSLAEIARRHALRIAVMSAGDSLFFGLCADSEAVHDLRVLADGIRRSTEELLRHAH